MISRRRLRWLDGQLDEWVAVGLVSPDQALDLQAHAVGPSRRGAAVPLFAVLGAALIGLGVILLLGHNWELLSRGVRAGLCLGLLATGQGVAVYGALKRRRSVAWAEGSAVFAILAFAAGLALMGQTYQIPGDLKGFLETWWWVSIPLVYALESRAAAVLVIFQVMGLFLVSFAHEQPDPWHWLRLLALVPFFAMLRARGASGPRESAAAVLMLLALVASTVMGIATAGGVAIVLAAALLAAGLHALDGTDDWIAAVVGPTARALGLLGAAALVFWLGIGELWGIVGFDGAGEIYPGVLHPSIAVAIGAGVLVLARAMKRTGPDLASEWIVAALPLVMAFGAASAIALGKAPGHLVASLAVSGYGLALGASEILRGIRGGGRFHANLGMTILLSVIGLRFLTWEWSFTARGLAFIAAGAAFLLLNLELRRRARGQSQEEI